MKLTQTKIDEVIVSILGTEGLRLVKELKNKDNISEFALSTKLRRDIKIIRHMLYKLHNYNLVSSTRKKDKQKGWYIYYWTILPDNIKFLYLKNKKIILQKLKDQLNKEETEQFYICPQKCVRFDFDQAMDFEFHCPECGELIIQDQNPTRFSDLQKRIEQLEKEITSEEKISLPKPKKKTTTKIQTKKSSPPKLKKNKSPKKKTTKKPPTKKNKTKKPTKRPKLKSPLKKLKQKIKLKRPTKKTKLKRNQKKN